MENTLEVVKKKKTKQNKTRGNFCTKMPLSLTNQEF